MKPKLVIGPTTTIIGFIVCLVSTIILSQATKSGEVFFSVSFLALILGILLEYWRISKDWKHVLTIACISYTLSLISFIPGRGSDPYDFNEHLVIWPFFFCGFFLLIAVILHEKEIKPRLDERITLMHSILFTYWYIDVALLPDYKNFFVFLFGVIILFTLYACFHAFTKAKLTKRARLALSIWDTIILLTLGIEFVWKIADRATFYTNEFDMNLLSYVIEYFLLGISLIYISQNLLLLMNFLPEKNSNRPYLDKLAETIESHTERYSERQSSLANSALILGIAVAACVCNFWFELIDRNMLIWILVASMPILFYISRLINNEPVEIPAQVSVKKKKHPKRKKR